MTERIALFSAGKGSVCVGTEFVTLRGGWQVGSAVGPRCPRVSQQGEHAAAAPYGKARLHGTAPSHEARAAPLAPGRSHGGGSVLPEPAASLAVRRGLGNAVAFAGAAQALGKARAARPGSDSSSCKGVRSIK